MYETHRVGMYHGHVQAGTFKLPCCLLLLLISAGSLRAQLHGGTVSHFTSGSSAMHGRGGHFFNPGHVTNCRFCGPRFRHRHFPFGTGLAFLYPDEFLYPAEYTGYFETQPPQVVVVRDEQAGSQGATQAGIQTSPGAKVIELPTAGEERNPRTSGAATGGTSPTIFIFLDGQRLEARRYMMIGRSLEITDVRRRTTSVAVEELDLAATLDANRERGIDLQIPSSPSEILLSF